MTAAGRSGSKPSAFSRGAYVDTVVEKLSEHVLPVLLQREAGALRTEQVPGSHARGVTEHLLRLTAERYPPFQCPQRSEYLGVGAHRDGQPAAEAKRGVSLQLDHLVRPLQRAEDTPLTKVAEVGLGNPSPEDRLAPRSVELVLVQRRVGKDMTGRVLDRDGTPDRLGDDVGK
jgi:hypothetical protein